MEKCVENNNCFLELESKHEFVVKIRDLISNLPRPVLVILRYLFAFLNQ